MSNIPFAHLHAHTQFSLLDGSNKIKDYINYVKELGMNSAAITDHGVMYGAMEFYKCAKEAGIHPIIGCEVYVSPGAMTERKEQSARYYHLVLLAENNTGYHNLIHLVSEGFTKGYYYRPRVDLEALKQYHEGIIALSGCLAGNVAKMLAQGNYKEACNAALEYQSIFGHENFFLELQDHGIPEQSEVNSGLCRMSKELGIPLVATNDIHYTYKEDADSHDVLLCIQTGAHLSDKNRMRYEGEQYYVKSPEEMATLFWYAPEAIYNTQQIANRCNVEFSFHDYHLPKFMSPSGYTSWAYLKELCRNGIEERYPDTYKLHMDRLNYELGTIKEMGFVDYFLITWDFIHFAKENDIAVGPGRGSAAGSLVSYCLGITNIDPIKYDLLFERFLNPERVTMPDIDVDFCFERRKEVIDYVISKYGADHVAQIITFGTLAAKGVLRDVGRVLNLAPSVVSKITKLIPDDPNITLQGALSSVEEMMKLYNTDERIKKLIDTGSKLEGLPRHTSVHAAGIVICPDTVDTFVPVCLSNDKNITTQFTMTTIEELGLLKMDFLGLRTLTVIQNAVRMAGNNYGISIDVNQIDYNDKKVFEYLATGQTEGVFQLESAGMKNFIKELKPQNLEELIAGISLYRPGPMDFIPAYINGKNANNAIMYQCPQLEPILSSTYGCIVYQEQVMQIVRNLAGYTLGRSDMVRRAMSKKKQSVMEKERKTFIYGNQEEGIPGCITNGIEEQTASKIYDDMIDFAKYAFNKSHAAAYAVVAYQTAYLKYYYTPEFIAALMTSVRSDSSKTAEYLLLCRQLNISVAKPDINRGDTNFLAYGNSIIYSLSAISGVGDSCIRGMMTERESKPFQNFKDFVTRMSSVRDFTKSTIESLIKAGALDCFGQSRKSLMEQYPEILNQISFDKKNSMLGQTPLFQLDMFEYENKNTSYVEYTLTELLLYEKEVLGIYFSGHPMSDYSLQWELCITAKSTDFMQSEEHVPINDGQRVTIGGLLSKIIVKQTKSKKMMAYLIIEDLLGSIEVVVFPEQYNANRLMLMEDAKVFCTGVVKKEDGQNSRLLLEKVSPIPERISNLWLQFSNRENFELMENRLLELLLPGEGECNVNLYLKDTKQFRKCYKKINANEKRIHSLMELLGSENIRIQ